jgi:curved DNA-binding protein CbpA
VRALLLDRRGSLWVATNGGGLDRFDPTTERFEHFRHDPAVPTSLAHDELRSLLEAPDGSVLDVAIPPGTRDGQVLRLRGKGRAGLRGGPPGDALVEIRVRRHPYFTRRGDDIHLELPVSLPEAVLGAKVEVPTPTGR